MKQPIGFSEHPDHKINEKATRISTKVRQARDAIQ
jgi:hypothetical protein